MRLDDIYMCIYILLSSREQNEVYTMIIASHEISFAMRGNSLALLKSGRTSYTEYVKFRVKSWVTQVRWGQMN